MRRVAIHLQGVVQGVGLRPFVFNHATRGRLSGWIRNQADGVRAEVEGTREAVDGLLELLRDSPPSGARIEQIDSKEIEPRGERGFRIVDSTFDVSARAILPPDLASCGSCIDEVTSKNDRRYRYPFTNCTECGPRYTILESLPYDRERTTMRGFAMCSRCDAEYHDPADRRFHAQPIACADCGPSLRLVTTRDLVVAAEGEALLRAVEHLLAGHIVALKGLGGFQLLADATNAAAVEELRRRKQRPHKPLAVMFPHLEMLRQCCRLDEAEEEVLQSAQAPICLVRALPNPPFSLADSVAPGNPFLGVMLPYTPVHRLLLDDVARPLVCTSGNLVDEPICIETAEAMLRLSKLADCFLVHDRPIARPVDDSVVRVLPWGVQVLRRARGYAPLPISRPNKSSLPCVLALGGHLKSTIALAKDRQVILSQHLGDLSSLESRTLLERAAGDLVAVYSGEPWAIACDLHPDYGSTQLAEQLGRRWQVPVLRIQHHHAHVAACVAEHRLEGPVLGVAWDGAGLGDDGTIWGGEALMVDGAKSVRLAHLRPFPLPGGEAAMRDPRRSAVGLGFEIFGEEWSRHLPPLFADDEGTGRLLTKILSRSTGSFHTTSMGRLFDGVAAILGWCRQTSFEGQAAMALEFLADSEEREEAYSIPLRGADVRSADWQPMILGVVDDLRQRVAPARIAARFHNGLVSLVEQLAIEVGLERVILTGGCFQNRRLLVDVRQRLVSRGFEVYTPQQFPPNDGGLSLGQVTIASRLLEETHGCA